MNLFIYSLICILFLLVIRKLISFKEGNAMVGSVSYPEQYETTTTVKHEPVSISDRTDMFTQADTDIISKKDVRVDAATRDQHWSEKKKDVDEKKDVDIMHRLPQEWNTASIEDCNKKEDRLFQNNTYIDNFELEIGHLEEWWRNLAFQFDKNQKREEKYRKNSATLQERLFGAKK